VRRLVALLVLGLIACGLVVGFGAQFNGTDAYPDAMAIDADYAAHVGERAHLWGEVTAADGETVVLVGDTLALRASDPPPEAVAVGDGVQVYGTLQSDRQFETVAYHVQTPEEQRNMYLISIVGIALAAGAFLRRWRVDTDRWAFVPREGE
jgi:hypothetical protein